ncbi:hypothetical protein MY3296_002213 [Beauveria thailandica]
MALWRTIGRRGHLWMEEKVAHDGEVRVRHNGWLPGPFPGLAEAYESEGAGEGSEAPGYSQWLS